MAIDQQLRITGIEHTITPTKWLVDLKFSRTNSVASPTQAPPVQSAPIVTDAWQPFPFVDGNWVNYLNGFQTCQYRRIGNKVELRGLMFRANGSPSATTIGTLPAGYRPLASNLMVTLRQDAPCQIVVVPDGTIFTPTGTPAGQWVSLFNLSYFAD